MSKQRDNHDAEQGADERLGHARKRSMSTVSIQSGFLEYILFYVSDIVFFFFWRLVDATMSMSM